MILVTCGTHDQPFDRLVAAARSLDSGPLVVQYGSSKLQHGNGKWLDFVSFEDLSALMEEARVVVSHAGVGSIILARRWGKIPLVVPRRMHLHEHVDDHQLALARRLSELGIVRLVEDEAELPAAVRALSMGTPLSPTGGLPDADALAADLRDVFDRLLTPLPAVARSTSLSTLPT